VLEDQKEIGDHIIREDLGGNLNQDHIGNLDHNLDHNGDLNHLNLNHNNGDLNHNNTDLDEAGGKDSLEDSDDGKKQKNMLRNINLKKIKTRF